MRTVGLQFEAEPNKAKAPTKEELAAQAAELGIDLPKGAKKDEIVAAIEDFKAKAAGDGASA